MTLEQQLREALDKAAKEAHLHHRSRYTHDDTFKYETCPLCESARQALAASALGRERT